MVDRYYVSPIVEVRCLDGEVVAIGNDVNLGLEGADVLLLAAFASPRTASEASSYLSGLGIERHTHELQGDIEVLASAGVLVQCSDASTVGYEEHQVVGRRSLSAIDILYHRLGYLASLVPGTLDAYAADGTILPPLPYAVGHWLEGYDMSDKRALLLHASGARWWSQSCKSVSVVELGVKLPNTLSDFDARNVTLFNAFPDTGSFDAVELYPFAFRPLSPTIVRRALDLAAADGLVILYYPEWQPEALAVLRETDRIEVNIAGFLPCAEAPRGCSVFLSRRFAWPHKTPDKAPRPIGGLPPPDPSTDEGDA